MTLHSGFRTYQMAVQFHGRCTRLACPAYLRDQLARASSSIALNLSEGSAKPRGADRKRFYTIAFGSLRECQTILELMPRRSAETIRFADQLAASVYRLLQGCSGPS